MVAGWDDGVEVVETAALEGEARERGAVEGAVRREDGGAELFDDGVEDGLARLHELATEIVGRQDVGAVRGEHARDRGFAAAETAGEADAHRYNPRRSLAARTVLAISMAMVRAPTPPGDRRVGGGGEEGRGVNVADDDRAAFCESGGAGRGRRRRTRAVLFRR